MYAIAWFYMRSCLNSITIALCHNVHYVGHLTNQAIYFLELFVI